LTAIQALIDQFGEGGQVLSCYADLTGADGFRHPWRAAMETKADAIRRAIGESAPARREFDRNLTAVRRALEETGSSGNRWAAAFSAADRNLVKVIGLDVPVAPDLVIHTSPYLVPLLMTCHRRREYLAVHTDTRHARVYAATPGEVRLLQELVADVPRKQRTSDERFRQVIASHAEDAMSHFQKDLVQTIVRSFSTNGYAGLILLGAHPVVEPLRKSLPANVASHVVGEAAEAMYERPAEIETAIRDSVRGVLASDDARGLGDLWDRLAERRAVATGPSEVLEAVQGGRLGLRGHGCLVLGPDPREVVGRCTRCRFLALDAPPTCPRCQGPCAEASLWEELLLMALRHDIAARFLADSTSLAPFGGVVALLPKEKPAASA
jgi:hypothetical protein